MKTTLIIALLGLASFSGFAQTTMDGQKPVLKNNGPEVFVRPTNFTRPYKVLFDPPCVMYKKNNLVTMECPGILMAPENGEYDKSMYTGYNGFAPVPQTADTKKTYDENSKALTTK